MPNTRKDDPRYKDIITTEEYSDDRFWEWGKWAYRLADGVEQFDYLIAHGLEPHHYLLDVGCGWLRGGINFIDYLDTGHYYGFDKDEGALAKGEQNSPRDIGRPPESSAIAIISNKNI